MGGKSMFELKKALQNWRNDLKNKNTFLKTDIQELENHLLAELKILKEKGLSEEEAFWVANRRLGETKDLTFEFSKINGNTIWGFRALWMALGVLCYLLMNHLIQLVNGICVTIAAANGVNGYNLGVVSIVSAFILIGTAVLGCFLIVSKRGALLRERIFKSAEIATRRTFYLVGFIILIAILILFKTSAFMLTPRFVSVASYGEFQMVRVLASLIWSVILPSLLVVFVFFIRRKSRNPVEE